MPTTLSPIRNSSNEVSARLLHEQIREQLRLRCRVQSADTALPAIRELSRTLGVNASTVTRSLKDLEEEGLIRVVPRKGIFVNSPPPATFELLSISSHTQDLGPVAQRFFRGMHLKADGKDLIEAKSIISPPTPNPGKYLQELQQRRVAGIGVTGHDYGVFPKLFDEAQFIYELAKRLPLVLVGKPHRYLEIECVYCDPRPQIRQWLERCYDDGLRRFGYLTTISDTRHFRERSEEFRQFLLDFGLRLDPRYVPVVTPLESEAATQTEKVHCVLEATPRVEAVIASSPQQAYSLVLEAHRKGIEPGRDLKILCFGGSLEEVQAVAPYVTVVLTEEVEVGRQAMRRLMEMAQGRLGEENLIWQVPAQLLEGGAMVVG